MKTGSKFATPPGKERLGVNGFSLIEMIGILAVIAILAAILLPALLRETDKTVADQEVNTLKSFADAFQQYVVATRTIPDDTTWHTAVSSQLGVSPNDALYNARQKTHLKTRVFLIDPALQMGLPSPSSTGLPYVQANFVSTATGRPRLPANPRVMIVSSLGVALPAAVVNGVYSAGHPEYFANLWNAATGTVPSDTPWTGWTGNPADVLVQRIDLSSLFIRLELVKGSQSASDGYYTIDAAATPILASTVNGYFIQGSIVNLYKTANVTDLDTRFLLTSEGHYYFQNGVWRSNGNGTGVGPGVSNLGAVVYQFLNATPNLNAVNPAGNAQQLAIVNDMIAYMTQYNLWASGTTAGGVPFGDNALKGVISGLQSTMMADIAGLYSNPGHFPANTVLPCTQ